MNRLSGNNPYSVVSDSLVNLRLSIVLVLNLYTDKWYMYSLV